MVVQPFAGHVHELRQRLLVSLAVALAAGGTSYLFRDQLIQFVVAPLHQSLIYTAPSGGFQFLLSVCLGVGVVVALPVFVYNLVRFIEPAFAKARIGKKGTVGIVTASFGLAGLGLAFAYCLVLPMSFRFFASFATGPIRPLISTSEYLSFVLGCLITFALIFQLPLLLLLINFINRFPPGSLARYRRYVVVGSLGLALVLPFTYDPLTQFVVAIPVIGLFEVSLLCIWLVNRRQMGQQARGSHQPVPPPQIAPPSPDMPVTTPHLPLDRRRPVQLG
jgi:sec-independent protein translocase protein TatC